MRRKSQAWGTAYEKAQRQKVAKDQKGCAGRGWLQVIQRSLEGEARPGLTHIGLL